MFKNSISIINIQGQRAIIAKNNAKLILSFECSLHIQGRKWAEMLIISSKIQNPCTVGLDWNPNLLTPHGKGDKGLPSRKCEERQGHAKAFDVFGSNSASVWSDKKEARDAEE